MFLAVLYSLGYSPPEVKYMFPMPAIGNASWQSNCYGNPPASLFLLRRPPWHLHPRLRGGAYRATLVIAADPETRGGTGIASLRPPAAFRQAHCIRPGVPAQGRAHSPRPGRG